MCPRLSLAAPLLASLLVAGCGGMPATPSAPTPSPAVTPQPTLSTLFAPAASATPEVPSSDKELEATLPDTLGGEVLLKFSLSGSDAVRGDPTTLEIIAAAGKSVDDFSIAGAIGQTSGANFLAIRLKGADEAAMQQLFERSAEESGDTVEQVRIGGRDVYRISGPSGTGAVYYVVKDDTARGLTASDAASAEKGLAALPW